MMSTTSEWPSEIRLAKTRDGLEVAFESGEKVALAADGAVRERRDTMGEYLTAGTPVLTIVRIHPLRLRVEIPERDSHDLRIGQGVRVTVEGDPETYSGRLVRLSPAFQELSRTLVIEAEVDNRHSKLKPGSFAKAEIETNSQTMAVMVPASAVVTFAGIQKVYLVKDGSAMERNIQVGRSEGDLVEITEGLKGLVGTSKGEVGATGEKLRGSVDKLQKSIEKMEGDHVQELITEKELHNIIG
jgi:multidrug efflux pump subunit AcrA (membrane-fusion protein)